MKPYLAVPAFEVCSLAGGRSQRMGRDKARVRLGGRTLLAHARAVAAEAGWRARVIRRDVGEKRGPVSGVETGLATTRAEAVVFLACDMPFVTAALLRRVVRALRAGDAAVFAEGGGVAGFPFVVRREALAVVRNQLEKGRLSLQSLAGALAARRLKVGAALLRNLNTPEELAAARRMEERFPVTTARLPS